jgi:hypothetical protein
MEEEYEDYDDYLEEFAEEERNAFLGKFFLSCLKFGPYS